MENEIKESVCSRCNKSKKMYAKKMCRSCYNQVHRDKEKQKACVQRWKAKNPEYFKVYYQKTKLNKEEVATPNA